ncbi:MAG TPA: MAPEG family protein [Burkholderiales bacterium]|nr:MAPEG family protein [Burkholderiales bacterium]
MNPSDTVTWLAATTALTGCFWIPYVLDRFLTLGIARTLGNPQPGDGEAQSPWARRARQAHANAVENLAVFAPLALLAVALGAGRTPLAAAAAATYFFARAAHFALYTAGVPVLRTLAFVIGFGAQAALLLAVAGVVR